MAWIDSAIAVVIGLWVLPRTWTLLKASLHVLLEGVPEGVGVAQLESTILALPKVASVHDLHVWTISSGKVSLTVHVVCRDTNGDWPALLHQVRSLLAKEFDIHHSTVQLEASPCEQANGSHAFVPQGVAHDDDHDAPVND